MSKGPLRFGISFLHPEWAALTPAGRRELLAGCAAAGADHVVVADHVSFHGGDGFDGLISAASVLGAHDTLGAYVSVYLLALRHPVPVARQLATLAELHPGRLILGIGVGGDDRAEVAACGVDPGTRGRRTDEALVLLRSLLAGEEVSLDGEFFTLSGVRVLPAPRPPIPLVVGGRSAAALRRAARLGDGWLAIWVSPQRFAGAIAEIGEHAARCGRESVRWQHGIAVWCGLGDSRATARGHVAADMQRLYGSPFEAFERWCPHGDPDEVALAIDAYVDAGATTVNLIPRAGDPAAAVAGAAEVIARLRQRHERTSDTAMEVSQL
jgi:alkanesulfonate monooxygenase SsuD/methylene tetrahydromethanopterin reductase-like flavin-dependent oxidoreductase (luciferase family)